MLVCNRVVAAGTPLAAVSIEPLTDWLFCLATSVVNVYAIRQSSSFILVDTGVAGREHAYIRALEQIAGTRLDEVNLAEIFLTHGHDDHTGSAAALVKLTNARVRGPALDAEVIEARATRADPKLLDWEIPLFERYGKVAPAPPVNLDATVRQGDRLDWDRAAEVIAAPGHTAGSVALFFAENRVLLAGDAIMSLEGEPRLGAFNADPDKARSSARRLARFEPDLLCVGHGPAIKDASSSLARMAEKL